MARRAASIWRAVRRPRVSAFRPYSPKLTLAPRVAIPLLRPFCSLRYFLLAGCSMLYSCASFLGRGFRRGPVRGFVGDQRLRRRRRRGQRLLVFGQDLAFEHPHFDADDAVGGLCFGETVVDVGPQRVQRHAAFAVPLRARDLDAVQAARAHDRDALRTQPHRIGDRALHRATVHDALLQLLREPVRNQLRVEFRLADFLDVDVHGHMQQFLQLRLQRFDVLALLANDDTGARAEYGDLGVLRGALDDDFADRRVRKLLLQEVPDLDVFLQHAREILAVRIPLRRPVAQHREAESDRMYFLSHGYFLPSPTVSGMWQ